MVYRCPIEGRQSETWPISLGISPKGIPGFGEETKALVKQLYEDDVRTPKAIIAAFRTRGLPDPPTGPRTRFLQVPPP